jgi:hypothetical protein
MFAFFDFSNDHASWNILPLSNVVGLVPATWPVLIASDLGHGFTL